MMHSRFNQAALPAAEGNAPADFWRALDHLRDLLSQGATHEEVAPHLAAISPQTTADPRLGTGRKLAFGAFCRHFGLTHGPQTADAIRSQPERSPMPPANLPPEVADFSDFDLPGISIVTCCRDRNANLLQSLRSWLLLAVDEIIVVDWSSETPVSETLARAGISDPRIRIARVGGERRWILSQAFNLGFRLARFATLLKADADITLSPDFLQRNPLPPATFIAGNWRNAPAGQEFVNGFFLVRRSDLAAVNGFNEFITSYGWDDDDLYDRLHQHGLTRRGVAADSLYHIDHGDGERLGRHHDPRPALGDTPLISTRTNRLIATLMPPWAPSQTLTRFRRNDDRNEGELYRVDTTKPVPAALREMARWAATCDMVSWHAGPKAWDLSKDALTRLAATLPIEEITSLRVELLLTGQDDAGLSDTGFLLADMPDPAGTSAFDRAVSKAISLAGDRQVVLRVPVEKTPAHVRLPILPTGPLPEGAYSLATCETAAGYADKILHVDLSVECGLAAPSVSRPAERLFVDVRHGLGNRLRAMASGAAIAGATGRELVIVWTPDHHCRARLRDLFHWPGGAVVEGATPSPDATFLNYMEGEPDAAKGAVLQLTGGRDAWVRTAHVINHPASHWMAENRALRDLSPAAGVQHLLRQMPASFDIGLHVRMQGAAGHRVASHDRVENWTAEAHEQIVHWRGQSHHDRFIARLEQRLKTAPDSRFFLAADMKQSYLAFQDRFGDRVQFLPRRKYDRSVDQLRHAMADILLLARSRHLMRSNWSSFSEAAMRLSAHPQTSEIAGVDF